MRLETERLVLRRFEVYDAGQALEYLSDEKTMCYIEEPYNLQQTIEFINKYGCGENPYVYALLEKKTDRLIGHIVFHPYEHPQIFEIGFIIKSDYWGKGYAYETAKAVIKYGFSQLVLHKIVAHTIAPNHSSIHLLQKLGFMEEARLRLQNFHNGAWADEYCFGLLKEDMTLQGME